MTPGSFTPVAHGDNDRDVVAYERAAYFLPFRRVGGEIRGQGTSTVRLGLEADCWLLLCSYMAA